MGNNGPSLIRDFKKVFKVHLNNNISEGELQLINTYSGIYYALTNEYKNQKSAIILLDEPDKSFHPMWISSFIDNLVKLVESIDNDRKYQFIISTHSPFMLSDVPKDCITCIDIVDHQRIVSKAKKSFASNYYDIINKMKRISKNVLDIILVIFINIFIADLNFALLLFLFLMFIYDIFLTSNFGINVNETTKYYFPLYMLGYVGFIIKYFSLPLLYNFIEKKVLTI